MAAKNKTLTQKHIIPATLEQVYDALLNNATLAAYTGAKATGTAKVGSKFTAYDGYISGVHLVLEKNKRIVQEWKTTEWPANAPPSRLEISLAQAKGGTELCMVHSELPAGQAAYLDKGWKDFYWTPLRMYFEQQNKAPAKPTKPAKAAKSKPTKAAKPAKSKPAKTKPRKAQSR